MSLEAVICSAGRGTRLNFSGPKTLFPVLNRPILEWLLNEIPTNITAIAIVCSPNQQEKFERFFETFSNPRNFKIRFVIQPTAIGTADAVFRAIDSSIKSKCLIVWGDQIGLDRVTFNKVLKVSETEEQAFVLPLLESPTPYVNFEFDDRFRIVGFNETKRTGKYAQSGFTDCGTFVIEKAIFLEFLISTRSFQEKDIAEQGECNILNLFSLYETLVGPIKKVILQNQNIRVSVNNRLEAIEAEKYLKTRSRQNG